jgi:CheY-like chemotaxis protein
MSLRFSCPCGQKLKTPDGSVNKRARCVKCSRWLRIPESSVYETIAEAVPAPSASVTPEPTDHGTGEFTTTPLARTVPLPPNNHNKITDMPLVLVADSDPVALAKTVAMLKEHSYAVAEVHDGVAAIDQARTKMPDAMVLDVRLDNISGFQVIQQIRNMANPHNKDSWHIPALMTTTKLKGRDKQYAMSIGVNDLFVKPLIPAETMEWVEKAVKDHRARYPRK